MSKALEIIEKINNLKILQTDGDFENIPQDIWDELLGNCVSTRENIIEHRHYQKVTDVYNIDDTFIGIQYIDKIYNENSDFESCYHHYVAFEMEPMQTITYKRK